MQRSCGTSATTVVHLHVQHQEALSVHQPDAAAPQAQMHLCSAGYTIILVCCTATGQCALNAILAARKVKSALWNLELAEKYSWAHKIREEQITSNPSTQAEQQPSSYSNDSTPCTCSGRVNLAGVPHTVITREINLVLITAPPISTKSLYK